MTRPAHTIADRYRVVRDDPRADRALPVTGWLPTHEAAENWISRNRLADCRVQREGGE